ncbi:hypothetical protein [Planktotalea sp.]|uniref:hypothetical protein n=1 Tax=Planktotalea sp. TaxID=2029877 RepID=UPI0025E4F031|nr:hypothetical protein [Planktotalea sp.]
MAMLLDVTQINDPAGSDWLSDEAFEALKGNIARLGQTQPIRVSPVDSDWRPNEGSPLQTDSAVVVQPGCRRIEVYCLLGLPVLAILSTD